VLTVKFNVATESQPAAFVPLNVYTPDVVYVVPFHVYELQAVSDELEEVGDLIVKFKVATESHPTAFVVVYVLTPLVVYVTPFHKYELHTD
jgi:UV DNA damage repair endonuclease